MGGSLSCPQDPSSLPNATCSSPCASMQLLNLRPKSDDYEFRDLIAGSSKVYAGRYKGPPCTLGLIEVPNVEVLKYKAKFEVSKELSLGRRLQHTPAIGIGVAKAAFYLTPQAANAAAGLTCSAFAVVYDPAAETVAAAYARKQKAAGGPKEAANWLHTSYSALGSSLDQAKLAIQHAETTLTLVTGSDRLMLLGQGSAVPCDSYTGAGKLECTCTSVCDAGATAGYSTTPPEVHSNTVTMQSTMFCLSFAEAEILAEGKLSREILSNLRTTHKGGPGGEGLDGVAWLHKVLPAGLEAYAGVLELGLMEDPHKRIRIEGRLGHVASMRPEAMVGKLEKLQKSMMDIPVVQAQLDIELRPYVGAVFRASVPTEIQTAMLFEAPHEEAFLCERPTNANFDRSRGLVNGCRYLTSHTEQRAEFLRSFFQQQDIEYNGVGEARSAVSRWLLEDTFCRNLLLAMNRAALLCGNDVARSCFWEPPTHRGTAAAVSKVKPDGRTLTMHHVVALLRHTSCEEQNVPAASAAGPSTGARASGTQAAAAAVGSKRPFSGGSSGGSRSDAVSKGTPDPEDTGADTGKAEDAAAAAASAPAPPAAPSAAPPAAPAAPAGVPPASRAHRPTQADWFAAEVLRTRGLPGQENCSLLDVPSPIGCWSDRVFSFMQLDGKVVSLSYQVLVSGSSWLSEQFRLDRLQSLSINCILCDSSSRQAVQVCCDATLTCILHNRREGIHAPYEHVSAGMSFVAAKHPTGQLLENDEQGLHVKKSLVLHYMRGGRMDMSYTVNGLQVQPELQEVRNLLFAYTQGAYWRVLKLLADKQDPVILTFASTLNLGEMLHKALRRPVAGARDMLLTDAVVALGLYQPNVSKLTAHQFPSFCAVPLRVCKANILHWEGMEERNLAAILDNADSVSEKDACQQLVEYINSKGGLDVTVKSTRTSTGEVGRLVWPPKVAAPAAAAAEGDGGGASGGGGGASGGTAASGGV